MAIDSHCHLNDLWRVNFTLELTALHSLIRSTELTEGEIGIALERMDILKGKLFHGKD